MSKLLRFSFLSVCAAVVSVLFGFSINSALTFEPEVENYYFPVLLTGSRAETTQKYATAILRFEDSRILRQEVIKRVIDSLPALQGMNKFQATSDNSLEVFSVNFAIIEKLYKYPHFIDTLIAGQAFLGKDTESKVRKALADQASRKKRKSEEGLPKATRDKEGLYANAKVDPDAVRNQIMNSLREAIPQLVEQNNSVYINTSNNPVFTDTTLLSQHLAMPISEQVAKYMIKVWSFRNAYPQEFESLNPEFQRYVNEKDFFGLFRYAQAKANPLQEMHQAYIEKYKRILGLGS